MITEIKFYDLDKDKHAKAIKTVYCICDGYTENVWTDIKRAIKEIQKDNFNNTKKITFRNLVEKLLSFDNYIENNKQFNITNFISVYYINILNDTFIKLLSRNFNDCYVVRQKYKGNCIDDFITRGVTSRLEVINEYIKDIKNRICERTDINEYHETSCFEKDFFQIVLIQKNAQKIVDNCKKQLESLSDNYTK